MADDSAEKIIEKKSCAFFKFCPGCLSHTEQISPVPTAHQILLPPTMESLDVYSSDREQTWWTFFMMMLNKKSLFWIIQVILL